MKNFSRLFVINNGQAGGWSDSRRTAFVLSVVNNNLTMVVKSGRDPFCEEINTAFGRFFQEYVAEHGAVELYQRTYAYRFTYQQGSSGRQTTFIEVDKGDGFPSRTRLLDRSCFGKCGHMNLFIYDFLDLCVTENFFVIEDGNYAYNIEADEFGKGLEMKSIRPRFTRHEPGWTYPGVHPESVVSIYDVVRDEPAESEPEPLTVEPEAEEEE